MKKIDFYFDFASPNAYLSNKVIKKIKKNSQVEINYIPVLLGGIFKATNNKPPMEQFFGIKNKNEYQNLEMQRFIERHELTDFKMNPHFPVISLQIIRGEIIKAAYEESGFDGEKLMAQMQDPEVKAKLISNTEAAVERGVFGIPTFFVDDEIFFGKDTLWQIEELLSK